MSRAEDSQFNVRSSFARKRAHELAKLTGMTAAEVVEEALRSYVPPSAPAKVGRLVRRGAILVRPMPDAAVTLDEANAALDAVRRGEV